VCCGEWWSRHRNRRSRDGGYSGSSAHSGRAGSSPASHTKTNGHPARGGRFVLVRGDPAWSRAGRASTANPRSVCRGKRSRSGMADPRRFRRGEGYELAAAPSRSARQKALKSTDFGAFLLRLPCKRSHRGMETLAMAPLIFSCCLRHPWPQGCVPESPCFSGCAPCWRLRHPPRFPPRCTPQFFDARPSSAGWFLQNSP